MATVRFLHGLLQNNKPPPAQTQQMLIINFYFRICEEFSDDIDNILDNSKMLFGNFGNNGHFLTMTSLQNSINVTNVDLHSK